MHPNKYSEPQKNTYLLKSLGTLNSSDSLVYWVANLTDFFRSSVFVIVQQNGCIFCDIFAYILASVAENEKGIIPRAIQELFRYISANRNIDFHVKVSYIEVYKEELRDLLELETSVKELHIREDEKGNTGKISALKFRVFGFSCVPKLFLPSLERAYSLLILKESYVFRR